MKELALDLRNNPVGRLDIAKNITDEFLEKRQLIIFTKEEIGNFQYYYASGNGRFEKGNLYILINKKLASSSEVLESAVQGSSKRSYT
ncbi:S41 family peptidase [Bacteroidetes bacterium endosymbiont of Geopemphigus sp.]|uniref:S41 family peptidase n=1 Tax=Bacteroidetes bacterium endosymbiont of Geopemphigus sp. TaxID=2047937 RepID=UPI000CD02FAC|nr:S41 family peptidase [Bacteroidetes bacterium endosymbiont of Geopemphigus sp.]